MKIFFKQNLPCHPRNSRGSAEDSHVCMLLKIAILLKYGKHDNTVGYNKKMGEVRTLTVNWLVHYEI